ncbi:MAG: hypothetical protein FWG55_05835 [Candidatus Bathyarchaeota archaeon]|nr:hypothetical protein [Candidatus Termiticorpusculum sp.]
MQFFQLLKCLCERGRGEKAEHLVQTVAECFMGVLSDEELLLMDVGDIACVLKTVKRFQNSMVTVGIPPFKAYIAELQSQGNTVVVGEKYQHLR